MASTQKAAPSSRRLTQGWPLRSLAVALLVALSVATACKAAPTATPIPTRTPTYSPLAIPTATPPGTAAAPQTTPQPSPADTAFFLSIQEPLLESVVSTANLTVKGTTTPDAVVSVNGKVVPVEASGTFTAVATLQVGPNVVEVVASDFAGHQQSAILTAIYIP